VAEWIEGRWQGSSHCILFSSGELTDIDGQELGFGVYDGFTTVITQPIQCYKEGRMGLYKGIGKGLGGILIKPFAGKNQFHVPCIHSPLNNLMLEPVVNV
jgi:hypothetical protein